MTEKYRVTAFYNGVNTFRAAFPQLSDATIEWTERRGPEDPTPGAVRKTGFKRGNFTQGLLLCSNPACHEGGFQADRLIAEMLRLEETEREGVLLCSGREVGEEVRRGPTRCTYRIDYKVSLVPRSGEEDARGERRPFHRRNRSRPNRRNTAA